MHVVDALAAPLLQHNNTLGLLSVGSKQQVYCRR
jgi:hypothetical protein